MADYKEMYLTLADEIIDTINDLKNALEKTEDICIETDCETDEAAE